MKNTAPAMNFARTQSHNSNDCTISRKNGRYVMTRRVSERIGYIIETFGTKKDGFCSVAEIVRALNLRFRSNYSYNDIYPTLRRMRDEAKIVTLTELGVWKLSKKAEKIWSRIQKNS